MTTNNNQIKKWVLPKPINTGELKNSTINHILQKVLCRRGINLETELEDYLSPLDLPNPYDHFNELKKATERIISACNRSEKIAICGDYDADGITSTALLVELLSKLGAKAISYIPSRLDDGYGLNLKMINEIYVNEINLVITVDNGVSAIDAIKRSNELGIDLIITDHHKIPKNNIEIYALIHPEQCPENSPYKYLAGVGIAYMLAKDICNKLRYNIDNTTANVLFCIGTVADMAPLIGANRKWLKECLPKINQTNNFGIRAIIKKLGIDYSDISCEDIGFKIAPLINAVGRIGDPKLILDLLTNSSDVSINKYIKECYAIHKERKRLTELVEKEAMEIAFCEYAKNNKFLVLVKKEWHPGIIGIVAARVVEKFNLPTAILSAGNDGIYRGSIRSNKHLKVNLALNECNAILISHGGHSAAAGFTIKEENIPRLKESLNNIAIKEFKNCDLNKSIKPDAYICLKDINYQFYKQLMLLGPFGISNQEPIFWTRKCRIVNIIEMKGNHIKMILNDGTSFVEAIQWNASKKLKQNDLIDIAFHIKQNKWKKNITMQLNIIDIKDYNKIIDLHIHNRIYKCELIENNNILITNTKGQYISSDLSISSEDNCINNNIFSKKILTFAEIALGMAA